MQGKERSAKKLRRGKDGEERTAKKVVCKIRLLAGALGLKAYAVMQSLGQARAQR